MNGLRPDQKKYLKTEDNIIKDIKNLLRLKWETKRKKEIDYVKTKDIRNLFKLEKI